MSHVPPVLSPLREVSPARHQLPIPQEKNTSTPFPGSPYDLIQLTRYKKNTEDLNALIENPTKQEPSNIEYQAVREFNKVGFARRIAKGEYNQEKLPNIFEGLAKSFPQMSEETRVALLLALHGVTHKPKAALPTEFERQVGKQANEFLSLSEEARAAQLLEAYQNPVIQGNF